MKVICSYIETEGAFFLGKSRSGFPNPKTNHESIKSTLRVDSLDQNKSGFLRFTTERFLGKGLKKSIFDKRFFEEKKWYTTDLCRTCMTL